MPRKYGVGIYKMRRLLMKTFKQYIFSIPDYPAQLPHEKDDGEWALGDPARPIEGWGKGDAKTVLSKASKQIEKDRNNK
jgi:hypothetical protein